MIIDQYSVNILYTCSVQVLVLYPTDSTELKRIIISFEYFLSVKFYLGILFGGLALCTVQSLALFFAKLNFMGGGLSPQVLMTRRPCLKSKTSLVEKNWNFYITNNNFYVNYFVIIILRCKDNQYSSANTVEN